MTQTTSYGSKVLAELQARTKSAGPWEYEIRQAIEAADRERFVSVLRALLGNSRAGVAAHLHPAVIELARYVDPEVFVTHLLDELRRIDRRNVRHALGIGDAPEAETARVVSSSTKGRASRRGGRRTSG